MAIRGGEKTLSWKITRAIINALGVVAVGAIAELFWGMAAKKFEYSGTPAEIIVAIIGWVVTGLAALYVPWLYWEGPNSQAKVAELRQAKEDARNKDFDKSGADVDIEKMPWHSN